MKPWIVGLLAAFVTGGAWAGQDVVQSRTLRETVPVDPGRPVTLHVDNVFGSIRVEAHDLPSIEMVAEETVEARDEAAFERARREVRLDVGHEGDEVRMIVDGPFRDRDRDGWSCGHDWRDYTVTYEFEIRVPRRTHLELKTVNDGRIEVDGVHGNLRAANVNGGITLDGVGGESVDAKTVNGPVRARFDENPTEDSRFRTVNGEIELWLQPEVSADLRFKTFNGDALTDFEVQPLPLEPVVEEAREGSRRVFRARSWSAVRVGRGGPQFSFETLNGDILIRNARRANASSR